MGKQTIESKIRGALRTAITGHEDGTVVLSAADIADQTSLTVDQVARFGRSKRGDNQIDFRRVGYSCGDFTVQPSPPPCEPMPPPRPRPDWLAPLDGEAVERPPRSMWSTMDYKRTASQVVRGLRDGEFVLPPWQRGSVWTEAQRVALLDTIMRGGTMGAITLWSPSRRDSTAGVQFDGCEAGDYPRFVVDGQQRLTTILMAARGDLDHWHWTGREWTTGPGFMCPRMISDIGDTQREWWDWVSGYDKQVINQMCRAIDTIERHELTFMSIEGSVDHMVEVYRRLATFGSPHSVEDLAHMDRWLASRSGMRSGRSR